MKVLVLSSSFPYPIDVGRKAVMAGFVEFVCSEYGADNVVYATCDVGFDSSLAPCRVVALPQAHIARRAVEIALASVLRRRRPIQEAILYGSQSVVAECFAQAQPEVLFVDTIRMMQYAEPLLAQVAHSVIYLDDLFSLRYQRMLELMSRSPHIKLNAVGSFSRFLPKSMVPIVHRGQRSLLAFEADLLRRREIEATRKFDMTLLLNRNEAKLLSDAAGRPVIPVRMLHHGNKQRAARRFSGEPAFLFLGNLSYPANSYGLMCLLDEMPQITRRLPSVRIDVVGKGASSAHREKAAPYGRRVVFHDFVDDLDELMTTSAALLAPVIFGTGIKIKILDALAYGLPVIGTPTAFDGIPAGKHFVVDDLVDWPEHMLAVLDPAVNTVMSDSAFACYHAEYAPSVVREEYRRIFGRSVNNRSL